ncbi:MAG: phosphoglycerate dehydrogenase, partial [Nitrosomonas sp.]|nr:phosphoglycerate dehydrogenase [Nitrosomonas sp.]
LGPITRGELDRCMHRGYPADKVVLDMMREIHRYFCFPQKNLMAIGLGGGHNGFSVSIMHLMNVNAINQHVYVDTLQPETNLAGQGGFFRQSWGVQILELQRHSNMGDERRIHFASQEGHIPCANDLEKLSVKIFVGVGHETTGATAYSEEDVRHLLSWIDRDPRAHHALIDATSLLGAMPWPDDLIQQLLEKCCFFMPFQKAIGGIAGYFVATFTPEAIALIELNMKDPSWSIPRQHKIAVPEDPKRPLSSRKVTAFGPFYDAKQNKMLGGIINTFSTTTFAETTFGLLRMENQVGSVGKMNRQSVINRQRVSDWVDTHPLFDLAVSDEKRRGAAVTLLKVNDPDIKAPDIHSRIIAKAKQLLGIEGLTHPNGDYEPPLDVARYVNAFPGTPGDFRAWIGGVRPESDITALLNNIEYAYHRAKIVVMEEILAQQGITFTPVAVNTTKIRQDNPEHAYKVLIIDALGLKFDNNGEQDISEISEYIKTHGEVLHKGPILDDVILEKGKIHFFYQPDLSREDEILPQTDHGQFDAVIAAATNLPKTSLFKQGGVRIGAGTGNMRCACWGGGNGQGGEAPLMNTPSYNSRATAQMAFKALLKVLPDLPVEKLHQRVVNGKFDTGKNLKEFPTEKLEGKRIAIIGFGNIGREMCKIAKAFNMQVVVNDHPRYQQWIESEGYSYAASAEEAAKNADIISPHIGLGSQDAETSQFSNAGIIDLQVLRALNDRAIVINYDRGEIIDISALEQSFKSGKVRYACIDTDIFIETKTGAITGPMLPYYELEKKHPGKMELLPHAAADTEHISRVEGAKQAVDQIISAIRYKEVINLKGDLPAGYTNAGSKTVPGVGQVTHDRLANVCKQDDLNRDLRNTTETLASIWGAIDVTHDPSRRTELIHQYGAQLILQSNRYAKLMEELGLSGPYFEAKGN